MSFIKVKDPRKREELIRDFIETRKRIKDNFVARKVGESDYQTGLTKLFKPVTETQKATAKEITDAQKAAAEKFTSALLPIKEGLENITVIPPIEAGEDIPALEMTEEEIITKIGPIASKFLLPTFGQKATQADIKPGDTKGTLFLIGKTPIKIENDDITIKDYKFKGTPGLWKLLTSKDVPNISEYKAEDLRDYIFIMYDTNTTRTGFNRDNKRIGGNDKMNKIIKPFVIALEEGGIDRLTNKIEEHFGIEEDEDEEDEDDEETDEEEAKGEGLKILPSDPNALIERFDLLFSSKKAGHTGVRNEIVSILDELKRQGVIKTNEYKKLNSLIKK